MRKLLLFALAIIMLLSAVGQLRSQPKKMRPIIANHKSVNLKKIPVFFVNKAKQNLRILYGRTSHGTQITSGMGILKKIPGSIFTYNSGKGSLNYKERGGDLGNPNRTEWAKRTRTQLESHNNDRNMIMWSWCGQASSADEDDINTYLTLMDKLEKDFPDILFVYMTGHLDGSGVKGNLNLRNEQIRNFCKKNKKILFDFADIESYDPDGNYFLDKGANDGCYYYDDQHKRKNWADEWCKKHQGMCTKCDCAHSKCLNCQMKGVAFWWMLARIAGWDGGISAVDEEDTGTNFNLKITPNPANNIINLYMDLPQSGDVSYEIYNVGGMKLNTGKLGTFSQGYYPASINVSSLPKGMYFVRLLSGSNWITQSFIKAD